jgi:catechol 2,3-dioxygenase-like lactoylglutathione lyase family enzyme
MITGVRFVHTNLIARDWRALSGFYQSVFGCVPVPPERDVAGPLLEAGTGVPGAVLQGIHLRLPGQDDGGITLEMFGYAQMVDGPEPAVNRPGFAHIAFAVDSVAGARAEVLASGGLAVGDVVTLTTADGRHVTWCYVRDPEGNIIELQAWS